MDQHGDERHHRDHDGRQRIVTQLPGDVEMPCLDPRAEIDLAWIGIAGD